MAKTKTAESLREVRPSGAKHEFLETARNRNICHLCLMHRDHIDHLRPGEQRPKYEGELDV
jgi:hypothetical protein